MNPGKLFSLSLSSVSLYSLLSLYYLSLSLSISLYLSLYLSLSLSLSLPHICLNLTNVVGNDYWWTDYGGCSNGEPVPTEYSINIKYLKEYKSQSKSKPKSFDFCHIFGGAITYLILNYSLRALGL